MIYGKIESPSQSCLTSEKTMVIMNLEFKEMKVPDLWKLETIGITDSGHTLSQAEEELIHDHSMKEVSQNKGLLSVGLIWINKIFPLNRHVAERRLISTTKKLKSIKKFEDYDKLFHKF